VKAIGPKELLSIEADRTLLIDIPRQMIP